MAGAPAVVAAPAGGRFAAFSFVDAITEHVPGERVRGRYWIPEGIGSFPQSLAAEAVGQLAAWAAMASLDFRVRPVAGLAQEIGFHDPCGPGDTLELEALIDSCTDDAISYSGTARNSGRLVLELKHSVGPMMPMEEFDDPQAARADFAMLVGDGRVPGACRGIEAPLGDLVRREAGQSLEARLAVPASAAFFDDHFPRRPVYPATLLMHALTHWAIELAGGRDASRIATVANVKMRSWILPGQIVDLRVDRASGDSDAAKVKLAARVGDRTVATAAATLVAASLR